MRVSLFPLQIKAFAQNFISHLDHINQKNAKHIITQTMGIILHDMH